MPGSGKLFPTWLFPTEVFCANLFPMKEQSPYEGQLDSLNGRFCLGRVISVNNSVPTAPDGADSPPTRERTLNVRTLGLIGSTDDQQLPNVKIAHFAWTASGGYGVYIPIVGEYVIVAFINSEPVVLGSYPLSQTIAGGQPANQTDDLMAGDFAFVTGAGSRVIIRSAGTVEIESTKGCRTYWLPSFETINTVCQNYELEPSGGYVHWYVDPDTGETNLQTVAYDNGNPEFAVSTEVGTTSADGQIFNLNVGPVDEDTLEIDTPNLTVQIASDGTTTVNVGQGKIMLTLTPDGTVTLETDSDANINVGGDANINTDGDTNIVASGDANVTASGNVVVKGSMVVLNNQGSGVTTFNSHLGVIDLITGVACQPSTTVFADV